MSSNKKVGAALTALLILCSVSSRADFSPTSVVYPTGVYPDDVTNVQAALDRGAQCCSRP